MHKPTRKPRRSRKEWQSLVDAFETSPLDLQSFCETQAIRPDRLKVWRGRLQKPNFIELPKLEQPISDRETWDVELTLGQNVTLRLRTH